MKIINKVTGKIIDVTEMYVNSDYLQGVQLNSPYGNEGITTTIRIGLSDESKDSITGSVLERLFMEEGLDGFQLYDTWDSWEFISNEYLMRLYLTESMVATISANYLDLMLKVKDNLKVKIGNGYYIYLRTLAESDKLALLSLGVIVEYR